MLCHGEGGANHVMSWWWTRGDSYLGPLTNILALFSQYIGSLGLFCGILAFFRGLCWPILGFILVYVILKNIFFSMDNKDTKNDLKLSLLAACVTFRIAS